ncbi:MoxR family ATPase [Pseudochrobactrum algeriensis]|uniref:MoxR-like ATPase n=1 Tax=Pseudochrobactrum saccharolyticum TaxID=354352 RepID=A0A7W8ER14_9HYPH|nr:MULTISPECIES: MoxR family ATPase [Pseudochrobactrum]MBX8811567.1 MoxR family ATPase [Ochrobactrum sp. MR34]KAB0537607.1 MoxR family ATPase [Pseudochrobactrum saccharolyticum]MBB5092027.1 MoxR-like ATPase [Pseudochrobactrum saccharolyticum]QVQ35976.1 MoxR family ATPase [Pseudochrobactrum algeriensis]QVQ39194.1 MoxR family ATPase [Pseudochrobactrum algeriensis]
MNFTAASKIDPDAVIRAADQAASDINLIRQQIGQVIYGQEQAVENTLVALLAGGHALLVGVPGLAKTRLVETLGTVLGLDEKRIQFTPDLMPSDIIGSEVMDQDSDGRRSFRYIKGPVFAQLLMADEINRASPRTQSALLQAMQEYHVSVAGQRHDLPSPFHVLATQNPLEQEGTYPLPEAQLDRFLMQIDLDYPDIDAERAVLLNTTGTMQARPAKVIEATRLQEIQQLIRQMPVPETVLEAILKLVRSARPDADNDHAKNHISWGPGPRAGQALMLCTRARALYEGRLAPSVDDVKALAEPVLQHRMALNFAARADGVGVRDVIAKLTQALN